MTTSTLLQCRPTLPVQQPSMLRLPDRSEMQTIAFAWETFMAGQEQGVARVRPVIRESWQRSRRLGVDPYVAAYHRGIKDAKPVGAFVNEQAAVFTLGYCGESKEEARSTAAESVVWATKRGLEMAAPFAKVASGDYAYLKQLFGLDINTITFDYLNDRDLVIVGDPEECIRKLKSYQAAGADHILCSKWGPSRIRK